MNDEFITLEEMRTWDKDNCPLALVYFIDGWGCERCCSTYTHPIPKRHTESPISIYGNVISPTPLEKYDFLDWWINEFRPVVKKLGENFWNMYKALDDDIALWFHFAKMVEAGETTVERVTEVAKEKL